ncbi:MAG: hypothetical protein U0871_08850 [Gemmataceae bacterium]
MTAAAGVKKYAVRLTYSDGLGVDELFVGPWAADQAATFFAHAVTLPGADTVWLTRTPDGTMSQPERPGESGPRG